MRLVAARWGTARPALAAIAPLTGRERFVGCGRLADELCDELMVVEVVGEPGLEPQVGHPGFGFGWVRCAGGQRGKGLGNVVMKGLGAADVIGAVPVAGNLETGPQRGIVDGQGA